MFRTNFAQFILCSLILAGTLINSGIFIYQTLTAYFLFTLLSCVFIIYSGIYSVFKKQEGLIFGIESVLFSLWLIYTFVTSLFLTGGVGPRCFYLIVCGLFFVTLVFSFKFKWLSIRNIYWVIIILALIESLFCICQYFFLFPSFNIFFKITGTWTNPNVTAMFLAMALGPAIYLLIEENNNKHKNWLLKNRMFHVLCIMLTIIGLWLLRCRTAYVGAIVVSILILNYRYQFMAQLFYIKYKILLVISVFIIFSIGLSIIYNGYNSKKESADGRLFVWKIALHMIIEKPLLGYGYGRFEKEYNLYQGKYFESGKASNKEIENSGHVKMAYNELLENTVEGGVVGLLLIMGLIIALISKFLSENTIFKNYLLILDENKKVVSFKYRNRNNNIRTSEESISIAAFSSIIAFVVMSLFNFTIQAIPVMCVFLIYAAITVIVIKGNRSKPVWKTNILSTRILPIFIVIVTIVVGINLLHYGYSHFKLKQILFRYKKSDYQAIEKLEVLGNCLKKSDGYYTRCAFLFEKVGNDSMALIYYNKALGLTSDPKLYIKQGYCLLRLNDTINAENSFRTAMFIQPSLFEPRFVLMQLFWLKKDTINTRFIAQGIVNLKPKIPSNEVSYYKKESENILLVFK